MYLFNMKYNGNADGNVDDWKRISDKSAAKILKQLEEHAKKEGFGETYMEFIKTNVIKEV